MNGTNSKPTRDALELDLETGAYNLIAVFFKLNFGHVLYSLCRMKLTTNQTIPIIRAIRVIRGHDEIVVRTKF